MATDIDDIIERLDRTINWDMTIERREEIERREALIRQVTYMLNEAFNMEDLRKYGPSLYSARRMDTSIFNVSCRIADLVEYLSGQKPTVNQNGMEMIDDDSKSNDAGDTISDTGVTYSEPVFRDTSPNS
jgi:hypothetical protein